MFTSEAPAWDRTGSISNAEVDRILETATLPEQPCWADPDNSYMGSASATGGDSAGPFSGLFDDDAGGGFFGGMFGGIGDALGGGFGGDTGTSPFTGMFDGAIPGFGFGDQVIAGAGGAPNANMALGDILGMDTMDVFKATLMNPLNRR